MKPVAILSSTVLTRDGTYEYHELLVQHTGDLAGIPHYIGHPATRFIVDQLGATHTTGLFGGLDPGESFLVAQLRDSRKGQAFTVDHPGVEPADLKWGLVTRVS